MDKAQALHAFWSSFGLPAIDEQVAYDEGVLQSLNITMPYITYESGTASFDEVISLTARLWYPGTSLAAISQKAEEIRQAIGPMIPYDGGALRITAASPFSRPGPVETGKPVVSKILSINAEYESA